MLRTKQAKRQYRQVQTQQKASARRAHFSTDVAELVALSRDLAEVKGDRLIHLSGRYSRAQIVEHLRTVHGQGSMDASALFTRLENAIRKVKRKEGRSAEDVQREIAVERRKNGVVEADMISRIQLEG